MERGFTPPGFRPAPELKRKANRRDAQGVGEAGIFDRTRHDHTADADPGDRECAFSIHSTLAPEAFLENFDHRLEYRLEGPPHGGIAARDVARQSDHRTAAVDILEVLEG